jgi:hypothetical protein
LTMETNHTEESPKSAVEQAAASGSIPEARMVSVRLDAERFDALAALAQREGLAPTAMARMLLHRAIRETERETQYLP